MGKPELFSGTARLATNKIFYGESAAFFAHTIKENLKPASYTFADFGGAGGGLCANILALLPEYTFSVDVFDTDTNALARNSVATNKHETDLAHVSVKDKSFDLSIMRYVLQWNLLSEQKSIISEIARVTKGIAIIQHCGPEEAPKDTWRAASEHMINETGIERMMRRNYFYSSRAEVEEIFTELGISYTRVQYRRIDNYADIFVERYGLTDTEATRIREAVGEEHNYLMQMAWVLDFRHS